MTDHACEYGDHCPKPARLKITMARCHACATETDAPTTAGACQGHWLCADHYDEVTDLARKEGRRFSG
jgi:hypothetical protein